MPYDRVIQDSDDEDDPLSELFPAEANRLPHEGKDVQAPEGSHESHVGVNFDVFLQHEDAAHRALSSSQQRREDRWIPATEQVGSMGTMMTEIGLAQQRLFDDDQAQYANQPAVFVDRGEIPRYEQDIDHGVLAQQEMPVIDDTAIVPPEGQDLSTLAEPQKTVVSSDWSQSAPSYNVFDSSLNTPSGQLRADFLPGSEATLQTELMQNSPLRRCASIHGTVSSPHDTEPFSSVISLSKPVRAKSDNILSNPAQTSPASVDEISLPVTIEIPKVEKRGRKKKQSLPVNDDDDELSHPKTHDPQSRIKPEKRKRGRPPKNPKVLQDESESSRSLEVPAPPFQGIQDTTNPQTLSNDASPNNTTLPQVIIDDPAKHTHGIPPGEENLSIESPPITSTKETTKKKLKRGKTTSAILTKTYESDVEDDVIWVDQRPIVPSSNGEQPASNSNRINSNDNTTQPPQEQTPDPAPAPKKRGRKRKKTAEQLDQEAGVVIDQRPQQAQLTTPQDNSNNDHVKNAPGISVVLETTTHAHPNPKDDDDGTPRPQPPSPTKVAEQPETETTQQPPETPQKPMDPQTPSTKGPGKHSPISSTCKVPYRVGLSKKARIAPLLRVIKR